MDSHEDARFEPLVRDGRVVARPTDRLSVLIWLVDIGRMASEDGDTLDVRGFEGPSISEVRGGEARRPWIGILFECCGVYARVYRDPAVMRYEGRCPRCGARLSVSVGPEGVPGRVFKAR